MGAKYANVLVYEPKNFHQESRKEREKYHFFPNKPSLLVSFAHRKSNGPNGPLVILTCDEEMQVRMISYVNLSQSEIFIGKKKTFFTDLACSSGKSISITFSLCRCSLPASPIDSHSVPFFQ